MFLTECCPASMPLRGALWVMPLGASPGEVKTTNADEFAVLTLAIHRGEIAVVLSLVAVFDEADEDLHDAFLSLQDGRVSSRLKSRHTHLGSLRFFVSAQ